MIPLLILLAVVVLIPVLWVIVQYNSLVGLRNYISESWSNVDTELKRRYDLIPNLVATVKGYAAHERATLQAVVEARRDAVDARGGAAEQTVQENVLVDALKQLLALREAYPDLKADAQFLDLQQQLTVTEDRIQAARRFYNANVRDYNTRVESFPSMVIASVGRFEKRDYFEVEPAIRDAGAPGVNLS